MPGFTHRLPREPWPKPSRNEEEYFRRREFRDRMEQARKREERRAAGERDRLRELYGGRCPRCGIPLEQVRLREREREKWADQCPVCRGIWLDREMFEALTRRERSTLGEYLREVLLQHSLGRIPSGSGGKGGSGR